MFIAVSSAPRTVPDIYGKTNKILPVSKRNQKTKQKMRQESFRIVF